MKSVTTISVAPKVDTYVEPWNPWRSLAIDHPDVLLVDRYRLPRNVVALVQPHDTELQAIIWLCSTLTPAEQGPALAHEMLHLERGVIRGPSASAPKQHEEAVINDLTVRRVIPFTNLCTATWGAADASMEEWARLLWLPSSGGYLEDRLAGLSPDEVAQLPPCAGKRVTAARTSRPGIAALPLPDERRRVRRIPGTYWQHQITLHTSQA